MFSVRQTSPQEAGDILCDFIVTKLLEEEQVERGILCVCFVFIYLCVVFVVVVDVVWF